MQKQFYIPDDEVERFSDNLKRLEEKLNLNSSTVMRLAIDELARIHLDTKHPDNLIILRQKEFDAITLSITDKILVKNIEILTVELPKIIDDIIINRLKELKNKEIL